VTCQWTYRHCSRLYCLLRSMRVLQTIFCACEGWRFSMYYPANGPLFSTPFTIATAPWFRGYHKISTLIPAAKAVPITFLFWIEHNLVRKRVCITGCDRRYVVFVSIHNPDYLHSCLLQRAFHCPSYLLSFCGMNRLSVALLAHKVSSIGSHLLLSLAAQL
jgi:hypothetical protein